MKVYSIFKSISGDVTGVPQGTPITILRLAGCDMDCVWCDERKSIDPKNGIDMRPMKIVKALLSDEVRTNCLHITGGEPILQRRGLKTVLREVAGKFEFIQMDGNGNNMIDLCYVDHIIYNYKLPSSKQKVLSPNEFTCKLMENMLSSREDVSYSIKFVCKDMTDYIEASSVMNTVLMHSKITPMEKNVDFIFAAVESPSHIKDNPWRRELADLVLKNHCYFNNKSGGFHFSALFNVQVHKLLGGDKGKARETPGQIGVEYK